MEERLKELKQLKEELERKRTQREIERPTRRQLPRRIEGQRT